MMKHDEYSPESSFPEAFDHPVQVQQGARAQLGVWRSHGQHLCMSRVCLCACLYNNIAKHALKCLLFLRELTHVFYCF